MREPDMSGAVADALWRSRAALRVGHDDRGRVFAKEEGDAVLILPDGGTVHVERSRRRVIAEVGGQRMVWCGNDGHEVLDAWRGIQAAGLLAVLGGDPDAPATPPQGALRRLAARIGVHTRRARPWKAAFAALDAKLAGRIAADGVVRIDGGNLPVDGEAEDPTNGVIWHGVSAAVRIVQASAWGFDGERHWILAAHPAWGTTRIEAPLTLAILHRLAGAAVAQALAALPDASAAVPAAAVTGNARIARIQEICAHALLREPGLTDRAGTPIRPLVEIHLPELLRVHAAAASTAPADGLAAVDAALERGVETIRLAVDEALRALHGRDVADLAVQLRFLELRHPRTAHGDLDHLQGCPT